MSKSNIDVFFCDVIFLLFQWIEYPKRCLWRKRKISLWLSLCDVTVGQAKLRNPSVSNQHIYKSFINMYNKLKTILKKDYYKSMLSKNKNNIKNTWALLKKAIGKENDKSNIPQSIQIQNEHVTDKTKIADSFNDYFASIGKITGQNYLQKAIYRPCDLWLMKVNFLLNWLQSYKYSV